MVVEFSNVACIRDEEKRKETQRMGRCTFIHFMAPVFETFDFYGLDSSLEHTVKHVCVRRNFLNSFAHSLSRAHLLIEIVKNTSRGLQIGGFIHPTFTSQDLKIAVHQILLVFVQKLQPVKMMLVYRK